MLLRYSSVLHLLISAVVSLSFMGCNPRPAFNQEAKRQEVRTTLETDEAIKKAAVFLSSERKEEREAGQQELIALANASPRNRNEVIDTLIQELQKLGLENQQILEGRKFRFWSAASEVFGRLRATESLNLLIMFIYCGDGFSGEGRGHLPAQDALVEMGVIAVPQLGAALLANQDHTSKARVIRSLVAQSLGDIGGPQAQVVLEQARQSETDKDVIQYTQAALATIARESR